MAQTHSRPEYQRASAQLSEPLLETHNVSSSMQAPGGEEGIMISRHGLCPFSIFFPIFAFG